MNKTYWLIWIGFLIGQGIWSAFKLVQVQMENDKIGWGEAANIVFVKASFTYLLSFLGAGALVFIMPDLMGDIVKAGEVPGVEKVSGVVAAFVKYTRVTSVLFGIGSQAILMSVVARVTAWGRALNATKTKDS